MKKIGGYLVVFDPGSAPWEEKLYYKDIVYNGKKIIMVGLWFRDAAGFLLSKKNRILFSVLRRYCFYDIISR